MFKKTIYAVLFAILVILMGCSPETDEVGKSRENVSQAPIRADALVSSTVRQAPDLDLRGLELDAGNNEDLAFREAFGAFTVSFQTDGFAKACAKVSSQSPMFSDFVRLTPNTSRNTIVLTNQQLCISKLESGKDYDVQLMTGAPFVTPTGQAVKSSGTIKRRIKVRDLGASIAFADSGFVLARGSSKGIPIFTTNVSEVDLELLRVSERSLDSVIKRVNGRLGELNRYRLKNLLDNAAVPVWKGKYTPNAMRNIRIEKALPIDQVLATLPEGLFILVAADARDEKAVLPSRITDDTDLHYNAAMQWVLSTNLGVSAAKFKRGMSVNVRALDTAKPIPYAKVDLVTKANDIVFRGETDQDGVISLPEPAVRGKGANTPSHLVVRSAKDFSFLILDHAALDLSSLDVKGRTLNTNLDAYLFTDRGIYRPRETVHLTGLVRNQLATTIGVGSVELVVYRPNGSIHSSWVPPLSHTASFSQTLKLPGDAPRGSWRVDVKDRADGTSIGFAEIDVQDFIPERLKVEVNKTKQPVRLGANLEFSVLAQFLYGALGSNLKVEAEAVIHPMPSADLHNQAADKFEFGDALQPFEKQRVQTITQTTDAKGYSKVVASTDSIRFPSLAGFGEAVAPLVVSLDIGIQEPGGRTTKALGQRTLFADKPLIGLRSLMGEWVNTTESAVYNVKLWDNQLNALPVGALKWQVQKMEWEWHYDRSANRWRYRDKLSPSPITNGLVKAAQNDAYLGEIRLPLLSWGRYVLTVFDAQGATYNRQIFYSGWSSNSNSAEPDFLEVKTQSKTFNPGETIAVGVESPFTGLARLSVWTDREVFAQNINVSTGENSFSLKTDTAWFPGAYVVVTAFRPTKSKNENVLSAARYMPIRAMGLIYLEATTNRRLQVNLPKSKTLMPRMKEVLSINVPQLAGKQGYAIVQAVDEGILQLTRFTTPAPEAHFFSKRQLSADFYDDYGKLLRGDGAIGDIRTGSDQAQGGAGGQSLPVVPTKSVVVYSGVVTLDENGNANVPLNLPDFNGTLRTMVSVWSEDAFGSAHTDWIVRDPIVAEVILPRYIAPGDESVATLLLANMTEKSADIQTTLSTTGGLVLLSKSTERLTLKPGERKQTAVRLRAETTGIGTVDIDVQASNGFSHSKSWELFSRYAGQGSTLQGKLTSIPANANGLAVLDLSTLQHYGRTAQLTVNDELAFSAADTLRGLMGYPWTCSEQTVSKASPTIRAYQIDPTYVESISQQVHRQSAKDWLQANVDRIVSRQESDGSIGLWHAGDGLVDPQLSAYLLDFLVTAELSGFILPSDSVASAYAWSYKLTENSQLSADEKLYVLSELVKAISPHTKRAVRLARALADRSTDTNLLTLSNLAVALRRFGDDMRADQLISRMNGMYQNYNLHTPGYYDSAGARLGKFAENLFLLKNPKAPEIWQTAIERLNTSDWWQASVHEQGRLLRAKLAQSSASPLTIEVMGQAYTSKLGGISIPLDADTLSGTAANVMVNSTTNRMVHTRISAKAPPKPESALAAIHGAFRVVKQVYDFDTGQPIDQFTHARVNDRFIVFLSGSSSANMNNTNRTQVMLKDPVPAGFQIESVVTPGIREASFDWLPNLTRVDAIEVNDDMFFAANLMNLNRSNGAMAVAYVIRATTPGTYLATQAVMEDMYAPENSGSSNGLPITVLP